MAAAKFVRSFLIEFGPITAFFFVANAYNFFIATAVLLVATAFSLTVSLVYDGRVPLFSIISSSFVFIFGGATLYFRDPYWLVFEYTIYNGIFALAIFGTYYRGIPLFKTLFGTMFNITERGWRILSLRWASVFLVTAVLNEYIWHMFSVDAWLHFRFIAAIGLCVFGLSQFFLARRERMPDATQWGLRQ